MLPQRTLWDIEREDMYVFLYNTGMDLGMGGVTVVWFVCRRCGGGV